MMSQEERIAQFQKMANDDPENELGHFSLARALTEVGRLEDAVPSFERTLALNPHFSKAYQLLGQCLKDARQNDKAIQILKEGIAVADERGDRMPRDEMAGLLRELGETPPEPKAVERPSGPGGFPCQRPGCMAGGAARQMESPPMSDELGRSIHEKICHDCWQEWIGMGVKVINELRLDLSDERSQGVYENYMKEFLGF